MLQNGKFSWICHRLHLSKCFRQKQVELFLKLGKAYIYIPFEERDTLVNIPLNMQYYEMQCYKMQCYNGSATAKRNT